MKQHSPFTCPSPISGRPDGETSAAEPIKPKNMKNHYLTNSTIRGTISTSGIINGETTVKAATGQPIKNNRRMGAARLLMSLGLIGIMQGMAWGAITLSGGSIAAAVTTNTTTSITLTINKPSGVAVGDIMLAQVVQSGNGTSALIDATGTGWTEIAGSTIRSTTGDRNQATLLYKIVTSAELSASDFSFTLDGSSDEGEGGIVAFTGINSLSPFDVTPATTYTNISYDNNFTATAITTATANSAVIMFGAINNNYTISGWSTTNPGSLTELYDLSFDATIDMGLGAAWATKTATGTTGNGTTTLSSTDYQGSILLALKPCVAPVAPTSVTATSATLCIGTSCNLNATSAGNTINWYTVSSGGTSIGSSASGTNFAVAPTVTTTYYAEAFNGGGCVSTSRTPVTVTVTTTAPIISCPPSQTVNVTGGTCGASVNFALPTLSSSCATYPPAGFGSPVLNPANGRYYALSTGTATWTAADAACRTAGGHLATATNTAENTFLTTLTGGNTVWIGFTDQSVEGTFRWVTGESAAYTNWNSGEPNNSSNEDFTEFNSTGGWNDNSSTQSNRYIIEFEVALVQTAGLTSGSTFPLGVTTNTFTATNASGITASCSFTVTVNANLPSIALISAPAALCATASLNPTTPTVTLNGSTVSTQGWQLETTVGGGAFANLTVPYTVSYADNGKKIRYYATPSCGATVYSNQVTITVNPLPAAAGAIIGTSTLCQGTTGVAYSVGAMANATSYTWTYSGTGATILNPTSNNITIDFAANATSGNLAVRGTNDWCSGTVSANYAVTVHTSPVFTSQPSNQSICEAGDIAHFSVVAVDGSLSYQWQEDEGGGFVNITEGGVYSGATLATLTLSNPPFTMNGFTYRCVVKGSCPPDVTSNAATLTINKIPTMAAAGTDLANCNSGSFTLAGNTPSIGSGAWSVVTGTATIATPTSPNSAITGVPAGTSSTLRWTITNVNCTSTDDVVLTNYALPTAAAAGTDLANCNNGSFTLSGNNPTVGTGLWTVVTGTASITTPASRTSGVTGVPAGTSATLRWTVTNGTCTASFDEVMLTNKPLPAMTNANAKTICSGTAVGLALTSDIASSYTWVATANSNITGESTSTQTTGTISDNLVNTSTTVQNVIYTVTPTSTSGNCAGTPQTVTVTVNPTPAMTSAISKTICNGAAVGLVLSSNIASGYSWVATDNDHVTGESTTTQTTGTISDNLVNATSTLQNVTYTVTATSTAGTCTGTAQTVTITVNPTPAMTSSSSKTICSNSAVGLSLTSNVASSYTWVALDNVNVTGESTSNQVSATINNTLVNTTATPQEVVYTVTPTSTTGSCPGTPQTVTITLNPRPVGSNGSQTICAGTQSNFDLTTLIINGVSASFSWSAASNSNVGGESTTAKAGSVITDILTNTTSSNQTVVYTVTPSSITGPCSGSTFTVSITVTPNASIVSVTGTTPLCIGTTATYTANTVVSGGGTGAWSSSNPLVATVNSSGIVTAVEAGSCNIVYTITGGCGGTETAQQALTVATPIGTPSDFGDNIWNVYAYNGNNLNLTGTYRGYYTDASLSNLDTRNKWAATASPSSTTGYQGCPVDINNFTFVHKRRGFSCGTYQISVTGHDDDIRVYINTTQVFEHGGYGDAHPNFWTGILDENSTVEIRTLDGTGDSFAALTFTLLNQPSVIAGDATPCEGSVQTYSVTPVDGVTYAWTLPSGWTGTGTSNSLTVTVGSTSGNITVTPSTICGTGTPQTLAVTLSSPATSDVTINTGESGSLTSSTVCPSGGSANTGAILAGTGTSGGTGTAWTNPIRVNANDNSNATVSGSNTSSQSLNATGFNFLSIPSNATIDGIQVTIGRYRSGGYYGEVQDNSVRLIKGGSFIGDNKGATSTNWTNSETPVGYGSTIDKWGTSWTPDEIKASNFGVALVVDFNFSNRVANVDYIQITVYYTTPAGTLNWYTASAGGISVQSGTPFNPVGDPEVIATGGIYANLTTSNTAGIYPFWVECSTNPGCRAMANFIINTSCTNPTAGGTIGGDQTFCSGGDPSPFTSLVAASGHVGTLESKWQYSDVLPSSSWTDIESSNSETYDPSTLTASRWYRRLARVDCADWSGAASSNVLEVTVNEAIEITLTSATETQSQSVCFGTPIETIVYTHNGSAGNVSVDNLPAGVTPDIKDQTITISGVPTESYDYIITITNGLCPAATVTGSIITHVLPTISLFADASNGSENQTLGLGSAITPITYSLGGSATGIVANLPDGLNWQFTTHTVNNTDNQTITITDIFIFGIPTTGGTYTISTTGQDALCDAATVGGSITLKSSTTWTGSISEDWNTATNWNPPVVPGAGTIVSIQNGITRYPVISANGQADCLDLTIGTEASLTINSNETNSGSLIVTGTSTGKATYNRWLDHTGNTFSRWYIASAPLNATGFNNQTNVDKIHVDASVNPTVYDFATYSESANDWDYVGNIPSVLDAGKGYLISLLPSSDGIIQFTGSLNNGNVSPTITSTGINNGWNAVGNPYTSAIKVVDDMGAVNFLEENTAYLNPDYAAIYIWNETASYDESQQYYKVIGNSNYSPEEGAFAQLPDQNIQAGQGFLVHSNGSSPTVTFTRAMQVHQNELSLKSAKVSWPGITLLAESHGQTRSTAVAFNSQMTTGLDVTYDAGLLASDYFQVYTHLVGGGNAVDFTIQCLPDNQYSQLSVPVGVDLPEGGDLVFKASGNLLPQGLYPIIEDRVLNTKTLLATESDSYPVTLAKNTTGIGRFYLSFGNITSVKPADQPTRKYTANFMNNRITIFGSVDPGTKALIYDISGRKVGEYPLENLNRNEIMVSGFSQRVYLLKIDGKNFSQVIKLVSVYTNF